MANKNGKKFNSGTLQSIIDNAAIIYDYEFVGEVSTNYVDVNPISHPESYNPDGENVATKGAAQQAPDSKKTQNDHPIIAKAKEFGNDLLDKAITVGKAIGDSKLGQGFENLAKGVSKVVGIDGDSDSENDPLAEFESAWGHKFPPVITKYGRP